MKYILRVLFVSAIVGLIYMIVPGDNFPKRLFSITVGLCAMCAAASIIVAVVYSAKSIDSKKKFVTVEKTLGLTWLRQLAKSIWTFDFLLKSTPEKVKVPA